MADHSEALSYDGDMKVASATAKSREYADFGSSGSDDLDDVVEENKVNEPGVFQVEPLDIDVKNHDIENDDGLSTGTLANSFQLVPLSPFEKIKLETDRRTAHGHPVILPTKYGAFGPVYDMFALFQNAIKKQLLIAYNTLESLLRYKYAVSKDDINTFFDWFDTFIDVVLAFLAVEEDELFPFLDQNGVTLPLVVSKIERMKSKDQLAASLQEMDKQRNMFRLLPPGEIVPRVCKIVPDFLRHLVNYYEVQSLNLPAVLHEIDFDANRVNMLRTRVMRALKARPNYSMYVIFMSHWLRGLPLKTWKSDFLGPIATLRYEQWSRRFVRNYQSLPSKLLNKLMIETAGDSQDGSNSNLSFYLNRKKNMY